MKQTYLKFWNSHKNLFLNAYSKDVIHGNISKTSLFDSVKVSGNDITSETTDEGSCRDSKNFMQITEEQAEKAPKWPNITQVENIDPGLEMKSWLQGKKVFNKSFSHEKTAQGEHFTRILRIPLKTVLKRIQWRLPSKRI